ncbi:Intracellular exo-alpha-(1-_5)-L-arabinofuranosidase [Sedimentisphaera cyanobacteriorum]|uniref:Intracellular exo-alpha-(1->5)-L-arabinofuranosidase n=2 Tax=Sedimentisphaera cyanobacteriorum TaxID=1940790 RepID=A0A1Q2HLK8_9BACT|nr:Intracellular exo-alpha-(1->5)-L-arabinofuranosidase [Sedimentisphaera cyanobacteriorum]
MFKNKEYWLIISALFFFSLPCIGKDKKGPAQIEVFPEKKITSINPNFFGTCPSFFNLSSRRMADGKVARHLKNLPIRVLRFPGGTDSDNYLWDAHRVHDPNRWPAYQGPESMDTDRFISLCRQINAEPLMVVNTEIAFFENPKRSVELAADWVHYCNIEKNYNIKYWEIGNEPYFHTRFNAKEYARLFIKIAKAMKAVDPDIKIAAVGNWNIDYPGRKAMISSKNLEKAQRLEVKYENGNWDLYDKIHELETVENPPKWWSNVFDIAGPHIDIVSVHWYFNTRYQLPNMQKKLNRLKNLTRQKIPSKEIPIIITEWNVHKQGVKKNRRLLALAKAIGKFIDSDVQMAFYWPLFGFGNHHPRSLLDHRDNSTLPNYELLHLFSKNMGTHRIQSTAASENAPYHFASIARKKQISVFLVNSKEKSQKISLVLQGSPAKNYQLTTLIARNTPKLHFDTRKRTMTLKYSRSPLTFELPPLSITLVKIPSPEVDP